MKLEPALGGLHGRPAERPLIDVAALCQFDLGWMAYDAARQELAAKSLKDALRLARQVDNRLAAARALAGLSHQAIYLGHVRRAIDYAGAARAAIRRAIAMTAAMQACAHVAAGEETDCLRTLGEAADAVSLIRLQSEPASLDFDEGHAARAYRDLRRSSEAAQCALKSVGLCQITHGRTRAQRYAILAAAHLRQGEIDAAAAAGLHIVSEAWNLNSSHVLADLALLVRQIEPVRAQASSGFLDQARELLAARLPQRPTA